MPQHKTYSLCMPIAVLIGLRPVLHIARAQVSLCPLTRASGCMTLLAFCCCRQRRRLLGNQTTVQVTWTTVASKAARPVDVCKSHTTFVGTSCAPAVSHASHIKHHRFDAESATNAIVQSITSTLNCIITTSVYTWLNGHTSVPLKTAMLLDAANRLTRLASPGEHTNRSFLSISSSSPAQGTAW